MQELWCSLQVLIQNIIERVHIRVHLQGSFTWILFPSLGTYSGKTLQIISFPNGKIFCNNKKQMLPRLFGFVTFIVSGNFGLFLWVAEPQHRYFRPLRSCTPGFSSCLCLPLPFFWFLFSSTLPSDLLWVLVFLIFCSYQSPERLPLNLIVRVFFLS